MPSFRAYKKRVKNPIRKGGEPLGSYIKKDKSKEPVEGKYLNLTYADEVKNVRGSFRR